MQRVILVEDQWSGDAMKRKVRRSIIGLVVVLLGFLAMYKGAVLLLNAEAVRSQGPRPKTPEGLQVLKQIAFTSKPLIAALNRYRSEHKSYPKVLSDLVPRYLPANLEDSRFGIWTGWRYVYDSSDSYMLVFIPGYDARLWYKFNTGDSEGWTYDPGTGESETSLKFVVK